MFEASLVFGGGALGNEHGVVDAYPRVVLDTVHGILTVIPGGGGGGGERRGETSKGGGETLVSRLLSMEDEAMKIPTKRNTCTSPTTEHACRLHACRWLHACRLDVPALRVGVVHHTGRHQFRYVHPTGRLRCRMGDATRDQ